MNITKVPNYDAPVAAASQAIDDANLKVAVAGYSDYERIPPDSLSKHQPRLLELKAKYGQMMPQ